MQYDKPIYIMNQVGVDDVEKRAVKDGIEELLNLASADLNVVDYGEWRHKWWDNGQKPFYSVDWYVDIGRKNGKIDGKRVLDALCCEPWRDYNDHYDVFVVKDDMYMDGTNFIIGLARSGKATVLSTFRFRRLNEKLRYECVKTETMHELGHVFGLPYFGRHNVKESLGMHCVNKCVMRQGLNVPDDWLKMSENRLKYGALCRDCYGDLREWFL